MGRGGLGAAGEALRSRVDRNPDGPEGFDPDQDSADATRAELSDAWRIEGRDPERREADDREHGGWLGGDGATAADLPSAEPTPEIPRDRGRRIETPRPRAAGRSRTVADPTARVGKGALASKTALGSKAALGSRGQSLLGRLFGSLRGATGTAPGAGRGRRGGAATSEAPVVAIASGKGGTGKSFLSTSLAIAFHQMGHRTTLVDCDFGLACDHLLLGVKPTRHLRHLVTGDAGIEEVRLPTPHGPNLIPGVTGVRQMAQLADHEVDAVGRAISRTAEDQDIVLLDSGAGITPQACAFLCAADHVVLVTNPEIAALTDAYAMVKTLRQLGSRSSISVVVNRVLEAGHGESTYQKLDEVAGRHAGTTLHFLGSIADDPAVTQRRLDQVPLIASEPDRDTSRALRAIARRLGSLVAPLQPRHREANEGFADRLAAHARIC